MKTCQSCKIKKESSQFGILRKNNDGLRDVCKGCRKIRGRIYRNNNPSIIKGVIISQWQKEFGISREEALFLYSIKRKASCYICGYDGKQKLHCDHDHRTGKFRGLLCSNCNKALGYLKDSLKNIDNAKKYLKHSPGIEYYKTLDKE